MRATCVHGFSSPCLRTSVRDRLKSARAFTFVEILACLVFLAILMPAVIEAIALSNRASVVAERSTIAAELAQNKLAEFTVPNASTATETRGDFGKDWPGYTWELSQDQWDLDAMSTLAIEVVFRVQGAEHRVRIEALVSGSDSSSTGSMLSQASPK